MTIKDLKKLIHHIPNNAVVKVGSSTHFNVTLKYTSDEGWIVVVEPFEPTKISQPK